MAAKVGINLLGFNHREELGPAIRSVFGQSEKDLELTFTDNASVDGSCEWVEKNFPQVKVVRHDRNYGYAGGHNRFFAAAQNPFVMVMNPDVRLEPDYLKEILREFNDPAVAAVTGKLVRPQIAGQPRILDGTGVIMERNRRGRERGQNEEDMGQYDGFADVFGVSGTAAIFRRDALEKVKVPKSLSGDLLSSRNSRFSSESVEEERHRNRSITTSSDETLAAENLELQRKWGSQTGSNPGGGFEYFDEDFFAYWEDVDLSWRLKLLDYKCRFAPKALAEHPRVAGASRGGYKKIFEFIRHHKKLSIAVKRWNWKNHLFCIIKNDFGRPFWRDLPKIIMRETAMLGFILIFETATLGVVPQFFRELPKMLAKRRFIMAHKAVSSQEAGLWFN